MPLPDDFSPWEHLQSTLSKIYNRELREELKDLDPDTLDPDITVPRQSLYQACKLDDKDTAPMQILRILIFFLILRKARDMQAPITGQILGEVHATRVFKPQITLFFKEDEEDVEDGYDPVWGEVSFRLMTETSSTSTKSNLIALGNAIKTEFGSGNGTVWKKGKKQFTYTEKDKGYQFNLLVRDKQEGKDLVNKILDIQNHTPDWKKANFKENDDELSAYPYNPGSQTVLGQVEKEPGRRPNVDVRFQYATCDVWGKGKPIVLFDRSFSYLDALVD